MSQRPKVSIRPHDPVLDLIRHGGRSVEHGTVRNHPLPLDEAAGGDAGAGDGGDAFALYVSEQGVGGADDAADELDPLVRTVPPPEDDELDRPDELDLDELEPPELDPDDADEPPTEPDST